MLKLILALEADVGGGLSERTLRETPTRGSKRTARGSTNRGEDIKVVPFLYLNFPLYSLCFRRILHYGL